MKNPEVTILSTLPPIKGMSLYTVPLIEALDKKIVSKFLWFKSLYPEFIYPGWTRDNTLRKPKLVQTHTYNNITWYNPISWIMAGFKIEGDTIHAQWWSWILAPIYMVILWIWRLRGKQVIITVHNVSPHEKSILKTFMNNIVYRISHKYIVHSESNKNSLKKIVSSKKQIAIIPHWIIAPVFKETTKLKARKQYKIDSKNKVILFYGNIRWYKGLDILLESFSKIISKWNNDYTLIIAGPCWQDWDKYQRIIDDNWIHKFIVRIDGFIAEQQTWELFTLSDVLILPYRDFDSQSWVIATNLHFNLPIIVSNLPWLTEVITKKEYTFRVSDTQDLYSKIIKLFQEDNLLQAREYLEEIKRDFEWDNIIKKTLDFYKR